jgi:hypothetical protein
VGTKQAVDLFMRREDGEPSIDEVCEDDAELAESLRLEPIVLEA